MSISLATENLLIDGQRVPSTEGRTYAVHNPATGEVLANVAEAGVEDVERAVAATRRAFDTGPWSQWNAARRTHIMLRIAALRWEPR